MPEQPTKNLLVSPSPHFREGEDVPQIMRSVIYALIPAMIAGVVFFGPRALALIATCVTFCLITEYAFQKIRGKEIQLNDYSAAVAGVLLALTLPPSFPLWAAALGSVVAMGLGKNVFGGLGFNIFNPALIGRAFLQAAFPVTITTWTEPFAWMEPAKHLDSVTAATPLSLMKFDGKFEALPNLLIGNTGGSLGETCSIALLLGALYLLKKNIIQWRVPLAIYLTILVFGGGLWIYDPQQFPPPTFHMFAGGMVLGAFFMATDMVTSPITPTGHWIFGIGIALLSLIIRSFGGLPEGVMYSILFMNCCVPIINTYTIPHIYGRK